MPEQDAAARARNFKEVALGYTVDNALREAERVGPEGLERWRGRLHDRHVVLLDRFQRLAQAAAQRRGPPAQRFDHLLLGLG